MIPSTHTLKALSFAYILPADDLPTDDLKQVLRKLGEYPAAGKNPEKSI